MVTKSKIEWTETTWNPVTGCTKVSKGCKHCYAERMARRLKAMGTPRYSQGFKVTLHPDLVDIPRNWRRGRLIFVNSMSDLFHPQVPESFIRDVFRTMNETPQHTYQILTKRSDRLRELAPRLNWTTNIWMGVSVENREVIQRVRDLATTGAFVKFLSCEPLIGPLGQIPLAKIDWVIVGGESGPKARPVAPAWIDSILRQCQRKGVPFFFKQWGGKRKKDSGRLLHGRTFDEMPIVAM